MAGQTLTYAQLDRAANRVAHALLDRLGPGNEPVALLLPQGIRQVAAVLGALKAGKIYVPLDPARPAPRLAEAIGDSGARLVLTAPRTRRSPGPSPLSASLVRRRSTRWSGRAPPRREPEAGACLLPWGSTAGQRGSNHRNVLQT